MGLAIMTELPLVIVNSQRGGPSTGLPTKTEQSDLYQAVYGRNGDTPMPVIAARCGRGPVAITRILEEGALLLLVDLAQPHGRSRYRAFAGRPRTTRAT